MMITIAIPKGRLYKNISDLFFVKTGKLLPQEDSRRYYYHNFFGPGINLFIAKPKAIPQLLDVGICTFGFCGADLMTEAMCVHNENIREIADLKLNVIDIVLAGPEGINIAKLNHPVICATEFPNIASKYLTERGLSHYILNTSGSTEGYVNVGADCIVDVCETGRSLMANHLSLKDKIMESSTRLYGYSGVEVPEILKQLIKNI